MPAGVAGSPSGSAGSVSACRLTPLVRPCLHGRQAAAGRAPTVAYADAFGEGGAGGTAAFYLASAFDVVAVQPGGLVSVTGLAAATPFARGLLDRWRIVPVFFAREVGEPTRWRGRWLWGPRLTCILQPAADGCLPPPCAQHLAPPAPPPRRRHRRRSTRAPPTSCGTADPPAPSARRWATGWPAWARRWCAASRRAGGCRRSRWGGGLGWRPGVGACAVLACAVLPRRGLHAARQLHGHCMIGGLPGLPQR